MKNEGLVVDDFADLSSWLPVASGQAELKLTSETGDRGRAMRLDFDFKGGGGFVVARKEILRRLPESHAFSFRVRGAAPRNKLEFKLVDTSGKNVWRWQQEDFDFRLEPQLLRLRNSRIDFAWGPAGGGTLRRLGAVEFVISAGPGGKGTVWIEEFRLEDLTCRKAPAVTSSNKKETVAPAVVLGREPAVAWRCTARASGGWWQADFHQSREIGGLVIDWEPRPASRDFVVEGSADGKRWKVLHRARRAGGARSFVPLPAVEARFLRLVFETPGVGIRRVAVQPFDFSRSAVEFFHAVAAMNPRGHHPRWLHREQSYWTCAGVPDGRVCALVNEEGMIEPDKGSFSLEPFLHAGGRLLTWADARRLVSLEDDELPLPSAHWKLPGLSLQTTVFGTGSGDDAVMFARYRVVNESAKRQRVRLFVALRPFQVNPPWQAWQGLGGTSEIRTIRWRGQAAWINSDKQVVPLQAPDAFGALAFGEGQLAEWLERGSVPDALHVKDPAGAASAVMRFDLDLTASGVRDVFVAVPFGYGPRSAASLRGLAALDGEAEFAKAVASMRARLGVVGFRMPAGSAREAARTFKTAAGQILINRDGPALQPGPRRYTRSWIRDGAIMGAALQRAGDFSALADFIRWFAPFQRKDGFVPCCVDRTGADWLVEHDSHGQLIFAVREAFRFTGDRSFLRRMWPHVRKAALFLEALREQRLTPEYRKPDKRACRGLLPESASHEGYLAHPVHSYWDDFWGLRGLRDAAEVAGLLEKPAEARRFAAQARGLRECLRESVRRVIADKGLAYVPGSVEWADFDPTATSNAVAMLQAAEDLPSEQLDAMFEHFTRDFRRKHAGEMPWNNYTAYEIRIIGALVWLGKRDQAMELLETFLADRRPRPWNQWPEISWRDPRSPGHLGDVPHTWIASEYLLAFAGLFAFEREEDEALVLAAGLPEAWVAARGGVAVSGLPTWFGALDLTLQRLSNGSLRVSISGLRELPRGGLVLRPPCPAPIRSVTVNGKEVRTFTATEAVIRECPAEVVIS